MASTKSPEQQNNDSKLLWQNVQRLRRNCLNNSQSRQPNRYEVAYTRNEEAAKERKPPVQPAN
jgi:hypothetical protein